MMRLEGIKTWVEMKKGFLERFVKKHLSKRFEYTKLLVEGPGEEDIRDFVYKLRIFAEETTHEFNDVRIRFKELVPLGLVDVVERAETWFRLIEICEANFSVINARNGRARKSEGTIKKFNENRDKKQVRCFRCGGTHYKDRCPQMTNIKCYDCGGPHRKSECGRRKDQLSKDSSNFCFNLNLSELIVKSLFNKIDLNVLIDSGADRCFMSREAANNMKLAKHKASIRVRTANSHLTCSECVRSKISVGGVNEEVDIIIMKNLPHPVVLGMNFIRSFKVVIDGSSGNVYSNTGTRIKPANQNMESAESLDISPRESKVVMIRKDGGEIVEFKIRGILTRTGITSRNGTTPILLYNSTSSRIVRNKEELGLFEQRNIFSKILLADSESPKYENEIKIILDRYKKSLQPVSNFKHHIALESGAKPCFKHNYRLEEDKKKFVIQKVRE